MIGVIKYQRQSIYYNAINVNKIVILFTNGTNECSNLCELHERCLRCIPDTLIITSSEYFLDLSLCTISQSIWDMTTVNMHMVYWNK